MILSDNKLKREGAFQTPSLFYNQYINRVLNIGKFSL